MYVFNSLLPVILLISLGKALTRAPVFSPDLKQNLTRLTYWIALPALLLDKVSNATFSPATVSSITLILILAPMAAGAVGYLAAKVLGIERKSLGAFVQGCIRGNNAFVGLPVIFYTLGRIHPEVETIAIMALAPAIIVYNTLSVIILLAHSERDKIGATAATKMFVKQLLTNPLLIACIIGLALNLSNQRFPAALQHTLSTLGNMAVGLALISIGASLSFKDIHKGLSRSITAAAIQVFVQPLIGLSLALIWDLSPINRQILLIYLACPTGVASYILADIFGSDSELAAHIIVVSTVLSTVSLSLVLALGG